MIGPRIQSMESLRRLVGPASRPLCLYSGGLDGSYLLHYLARSGCRNVTALTVDLGGDYDAEATAALCQRLGVAWRVVDKRQEFVADFVVPSVAAQAAYLGGHPICASLSRPLMAKTACELAQEEGYDMIVHTSTRSQNSLRRFNGALTDIASGALAGVRFDGAFGSPFELSPLPRERKRAELEAAGIGQFHERLCSSDANLWGREFESGPLDDPEDLAVPETMYQWTRLSTRPKPTRLMLTFRGGIPCALDNAETAATELIARLNVLAGSFGLGRYVGLEEVAAGVKVQEVREMPAAHVLFDAYRRLESACVSAECIRAKQNLEQLWVREAVEGRWYGPLRAAAGAFIASVARRVTGAVTYELDVRRLQVVSLKVERPLYIRDRADYEEDAGRDRG